MTFKDIQTANESLSTINIKGKEYAQVTERVRAFRQLLPEGTILTEIVSLENGVVTMKATIFDGERILATGMAQEKETSSFINKTSFIENCETSAVGRALGFLGIGIDASMASAEEVANAVLNQSEHKEKVATNKVTKKELSTLNELFKKYGYTPQSKEIADFKSAFGVQKLDELTMSQFDALVTKLKSINEGL